MSEQQWEYCELSISSWKTSKPNWSYACHVRYYSHTGEDLYRTLAEIGKPIPYDPFVKAMGLLGGMGWELVTVQHGEYAGGMSADNYSIRYDNRTAYFKRRVMQGRRANEPILRLE